MKTLHRIAASALLACSLLPAAPPLHAADSLFDDPVVVKSKHFQIRESDLQEAYAAQKAASAALGQPQPSQLEERMKRQILDKMIATKVLLARATALDHETGKKLAARLIQDGREKAGSEASYRRRLLAVGTSPEKYEAEITEQAVVQAVIDRELKSKVIIDDAEIKKFYDTNSAAYTEPEKARVSHILFATRKIPSGEPLSVRERDEKKAMAEKVLARLRDGEDFARLQKVHTEDPDFEKTKGELTFVRGSGTVPAQFEAAAFSLKPGGFSDIVTTVFGYHIIKLLEKIPPTLVPLEKAAPRIREILQRQKVQEQLNAFLARLRTEAGVEILK